MLGLGALAMAEQAFANGPCCLPDGTCVSVRLQEDCFALGGTIGGIGGQACSTVVCPGGPACGDGIVNGTEQCDDGNDVNTDGCRNDCSLPQCGDGIVDANEACDDGNDVNTDACRNNCTLPYCGDGITDAGEACDDGNSVDDDDCRNDCSLPRCGDGVLQVGEECDDGNNVDGDGCSAVCDVESAGGGCTPGYWKQTHHFDSWTGYAPTDLYDTVFGVNLFPKKTLLQVLGQGGGGKFAMGRHSVAALLSASSGGVDYLYTVAQVINMVQGAVGSGTFDAAHLLFKAQNELGCPLN